MSLACGTRRRPSSRPKIASDTFGTCCGPMSLSGFREWLPLALQSTVPEVGGFARGLCRDRPAVEAAFVYEWNTGQVDG